MVRSILRGAGVNVATYERIAGCRICGNADLVSVLSLGEMPLANSLLKGEQLAQEEPVYPLDVVFCPQCSLAQLTVSVSPEALFRDYVYFSSFSDTMRLHAQELVEKLIHTRGLDHHSLAVEVASNDGYLLQHFVKAGVPVLGVEPALNVARVARERGVTTITEFFGAEVARQLREEGHAADVLIAINVLAHVPGLHDFVEGIFTLLKADGLAVIEVPYVRQMVDRCEFDTIYHEHLCYYSLAALDRLFGDHHLRIVEVERLDIHGGSLRLYVRHESAADGRGSAALMLEEEARRGMESPAYYREFGDRVGRLRETLRDVLYGLKARERRLAAYGAAAKGSVLLNTFGLGADVLDFVVDRSKYKQGLYMPGSHLPIHPPERLLEVRPDYVLLLAWNFADEILAQQAAYRQQGGRFIVGVPEVRII